MKKQDIEKRTEELVQDIIDSGGYELWDVEYVKEGSDYYLRVYADILEGSSPGRTRKLKKDKDYDRSRGKLVFVKLYKAEQGAKEFVGRLKEVDDKLLKLDIDGDEVVLDRNNISSARLEYED